MTRKIGDKVIVKSLTEGLGRAYWAKTADISDIFLSASGKLLGYEVTCSAFTINVAEDEILSYARYTRDNQLALVPPVLNSDLRIGPHRSKGWKGGVRLGCTDFTWAALEKAWKAMHDLQGRIRKRADWGTKLWIGRTRRIERTDAKGVKSGIFYVSYANIRKLFAFRDAVQRAR